MDDAGGGVAAAAMNHHARSPEDVFRDFRARRAGIVKALTTGSSRSCAPPLAQASAPVLRGFARLVLFYSFFFLMDSLLLCCADVEKFYQQCDPGEAPPTLLRLYLRLVRFLKFNWAECTAACVFSDTPIPPLQGGARHGYLLGFQRVPIVDLL
jgi:hypothetical protein